jgi:outer membrane protein OmpA-like peptidoglycan-associated protein
VGHVESLLELLRGRAAQVLGARLDIDDATSDRLVTDTAAALLVTGAARSGDGARELAAAVDAADPGLLGHVPTLLADPGNDSDDAVAAFLGGARGRVTGLVAARAGVDAALAGAAAVSVAPVVAAWLRARDDAGAALASAAAELQGGAGWLAAAAPTNATAVTSATQAASSGRLLAWGAALAALAAGGILAVGLGVRSGDGAPDDLPAAASTVDSSTGYGPGDAADRSDDDTATAPAETTDTAETTETTETTDTAEAPTDTTASAPADAAAALTEAGGHTALLGALGRSVAVAGAIAETDPVTVFAPSDAAFAKVPPSAVADQAALDGVLGYHVVPGALTEADLADGAVLTTLSGRRLSVGRRGGKVTVGGAVVTPLATAATGDVLYGVGQVLQPPATINAEIGLAPITFESGSDVITPAGRAVLDRAVAYLTETPLRVLIEGHTDADGDEASNLDLSNRRAAAVRRYLSANGVRAGLLATKGFGEAKPVATNATDAGKAKNRRIAFRVLGPA